MFFQLQELRNVNKEGGEHLLISGNIRPTMALNNRLVRTNINYRPAVCSFRFETRGENNLSAAKRILQPMDHKSMNNDIMAYTCFCMFN